MPIKYYDLDGGRGVFFVASGDLTGDEYLAAIEAHLATDPAKYKEYRYCLADYTAVEEVKVSTARMDQVAKLCREAAMLNPRAVVALVAVRELTYGLARMWEMMLGETAWEVMTFQTRINAEPWIRRRVKTKFHIDDLTFERVENEGD